MLREIPVEPLVDVDALRKVEAGGRDPGNRMQFAVQLHGPPDDALIGVIACPPEPIGDDDGRIPAHIKRRRRESGTERRTNTEHAEEVRADLDRRYANRIASTVGEVQIRTPPPRRVLEDTQRSIVQEVDR